MNFEVFKAEEYIAVCTVTYKCQPITGTAYAGRECDGNPETHAGLMNAIIDAGRKATVDGCGREFTSLSSVGFWHTGVHIHASEVTTDREGSDAVKADVIGTGDLFIAGFSVHFGGQVKATAS